MDSGRKLTPKERRQIYEEVKAEQKAKRDEWINSPEGVNFEAIEDMDMYEVPPGQGKKPSGVFGKTKETLRDSMENMGDELVPGYSKKKDMKYNKGKVMRPIKRIDAPKPKKASPVRSIEDLRERSKEMDKYGH